MTASPPSHGDGPGRESATNGIESKGALNRLGCAISSAMADVAAHPLAQIGLLLFCATWFTIGLPTDLLTAGLSILAITLTQMVLNRQNEREVEAHRRDIAMHAKLDELVHAHDRARDEMVGIEDQPEEEIARLREQLTQATDEADEAHRRMPG